MKNFIKYLLLGLYVFAFMLNVSAVDCGGYLTADAWDLIRTAINYVQIGVPILLIVFGLFDFSGAVVSDDKDALKKAGTKFLKRCLVGALIFFIPLIIRIIFNLPGFKDIIGITDDPLCGL